MISNEIRTARASNVARLLSQQGRVFALESHSNVFPVVLAAAQSGFPRSVVLTAKETLEDAVKRGETLSPRSAELLSMLNKTVKSFKTPRLFQ
mgnify:CR=1 FL=1|jgi:hypothetical protein